MLIFMMLDRGAWLGIIVGTSRRLAPIWFLNLSRIGARLMVLLVIIFYLGDFEKLLFKPLEFLKPVLLPRELFLSWWLGSLGEPALSSMPLVTVAIQLLRVTPKLGLLIISKTAGSLEISKDGWFGPVK